MTPSWKDAKSAEGLRLFAILNVSWNSSVLTSWSAKVESEASFVQLMLTLELLCQSTGIWRSRPRAQGASASAATKLNANPEGRCAVSHGVLRFAEQAPRSRSHLTLANILQKPLVLFGMGKRERECVRGRAGNGDGGVEGKRGPSGGLF